MRCSCASVLPIATRGLHGCKLRSLKPILLITRSKLERPEDDLYDPHEHRAPSDPQDGPEGIELAYVAPVPVQLFQVVGVLVGAEVLELQQLAPEVRKVLVYRIQRRRAFLGVEGLVVRLALGAPAAAAYSE